MKVLENVGGFVWFLSNVGFFIHVSFTTESPLQAMKHRIYMSKVSKWFLEDILRRWRWHEFFGWVNEINFFFTYIVSIFNLHTSKLESSASTSSSFSLSRFALSTTFFPPLKHGIACLYTQKNSAQHSPPIVYIVEYSEMSGNGWWMSSRI